MECVAVIVASVGVIFARLALMQDLNPFLWGSLAIVASAGAPGYMIFRGASWMDAGWVWISSFGGLFVLFIVQSAVAAKQRDRERSPRQRPRNWKKKGNNPLNNYH
jgi:hypothetical protein